PLVSPVHLPSPRSLPPRRSSDLLRVGSLRLLQPAELLVGVGEVVEHRGPTTPLLGREPQGLHRFTPARLLQGDEPDEEVGVRLRSEEHTSELQSRVDLVCRLLLE